MSIFIEDAVMRILHLACHLLFYKSFSFQINDPRFNGSVMYKNCRKLEVCQTHKLGACVIVCWYVNLHCASGSFVCLRYWEWASEYLNFMELV